MLNMKKFLILIAISLLSLVTLCGCTRYHEINAHDVRIKPEQVTEIASAINQIDESEVHQCFNKKVMIYSLGDWEITLMDSSFKVKEFTGIVKIVQYKNYFEIWLTSSTKNYVISNTLAGYIIS